MKQIRNLRHSRRALAFAIAMHLANAGAQPAPSAADEAGSPGPESADTVNLKGVKVEGRTDNGNQELYLDEKRHAPVITEALSSEQISRTGDSDAATTLKRVPGLSLIDGRYIYVRGLGERYSSVLLNSAAFAVAAPW